MESLGTKEKLRFRQVTVLAGIITWFSLHRENDAFLFKTGFLYGHIPFSQVLLHNYMPILCNYVSPP